MRDSETISRMLLSKAVADERIRAVLLNGSRANPKISPDPFQDYDIVYLVTDVASFTSDHKWIREFGETIIVQMPGSMELSQAPENKHSFAYLMLFDDGNRIDLTLFPVERLFIDFQFDCLTKVLLDKDNFFSSLPSSTDLGYLIPEPGEKKFRDVCNEFWWVSTYVAKGLCRNDITYAKEMFEIPVRKMFMVMIEWSIGSQHDFTVSVGKAGRLMKNYLAPALYSKILETYPDHRPENIWRSLFLMAELFSEFAIDVSGKLQFSYNDEEEKKVRQYLKKLFNDRHPGSS